MADNADHTAPAAIPASSINTIVTGLARGQLFETRLADSFRARLFDPQTIDGWILNARKAYHKINDAPNQLLDVKIFNNDDIFEEIRFVDFYCAARRSRENS